MLFFHSARASCMQLGKMILGICTNLSLIHSSVTIQISLELAICSLSFPGVFSPARKGHAHRLLSYFFRKLSQCSEGLFFPVL